MRINNKYLRNHSFRIKYWKLIRRQEHPYRTYFPYMFGEYCPHSSYEEQVQRNLELIEEKSRAIESGKRVGWGYNAPSIYRRILNRKQKAKEHNLLKKINNGDYELEIPIPKKNVNWLYF